MFKSILTWVVGRKAVSEEGPAYHARELWWYTSTDPKTRRTSEKPVLVFHKASEGMFWGLPLMATKTKGKMLYVPRLKNGKKVPVLSQMRTLRARHLVRRIGKAGDKEFTVLNASVMRLLAGSDPVKSGAPVRVPALRRVAPTRYSRPVSPFPVYTLQLR